MTTTQSTAGQELTATLRRYFSVGTRTRRYRTDSNGLRCDLHRDMTEALIFAATMPGYFSERTESALKTGSGAALAYEKHVQGYRISGTLAAEINGMSAWNFAATARPDGGRGRHEHRSGRAVLLRDGPHDQAGGVTDETNRAADGPRTWPKLLAEADDQAERDAEAAYDAAMRDSE